MKNRTSAISSAFLFPFSNNKKLSEQIFYDIRYEWRDKNLKPQIQVLKNKLEENKKSNFS